MATSISIYLVDGSPAGLRTAEIGMSTVKAVAAPRGSLAAVGAREESRRTGVYLIAGEDPASPGRLAIYIGEGDVVFDRIAAHDRDEAKDFFDRVIIFVSKDENLTKAHVRHLEARLVKLAKETNRCTVVNGNAPVGGNLPEAHRSDMDVFAAQVRLLASTLGVPAFDPPATHPVDGAAPAPVDVSLLMAGDGYTGRCSVVDGEYIVLKNSSARLAEAPSLHPNIKNMRAQLETAGVVRRSGGALQFTQDYAFTSASTSAQVLCGSTVNGRIAWKLEDGRTLRDWEDAQAT